MGSGEHTPSFYSGKCCLGQRLCHALLCLPSKPYSNILEEVMLNTWGKKTSRSLPNRVSSGGGRQEEERTLGGTHSASRSNQSNSAFSSLMLWTLRKGCHSQSGWKIAALALWLPALWSYDCLLLHWEKGLSQNDSVTGTLKGHLVSSFVPFIQSLIHSRHSTAIRNTIWEKQKWYFFFFDKKS